MKKRILSLALSLSLVLGLTAPTALAAGTQPERGTITYTEVIKPQYEDAGRFMEGLAAVKKNGKWGYIDTDNKVVIPFQYEMAFEFREGKAVVCVEASTDTYNDAGRTYYDVGFIDMKGNYTPFTDMWGESEQLWADVYKTNDLFFHNGYVLFSPVSDERELNGLYGTDGTRLDLNAWYPLAPMNEGLIAAVEDGSWSVGWVDKNGNKAMDYLRDWDMNNCIYVSNVLSFNQGLAPVWQATYHPDTEETTYLLGFMNRSFQWEVEPQYTDYFYSGVNSSYRFFGTTGLAMMQRDGKYGAIDKAGNTVIPFQYDELWPVQEGMSIYLKDGRYGYLDAATLKEVIPAQFEKASEFNIGLAVVHNGGKTYLIDKKGIPVPGADKLDLSTYFIEYEDGRKTVYEPDEYVVIQENGKYGYGHIEYTTMLPSSDELDAWAYDLVSAAIEEELVPADLQNLYRNNITRGEFCDMIVQALETILEQDIQGIVLNKTGKSLSEHQMAYPFTDATSVSIIAANALGVISGKGDGTFGPYDSISRQEAAAMLTRAAEVLGLDTANAKDAGFADKGQIASYFTNAVNFICQSNVMTGTSSTTFTPLGTYTREQAYITILRLFQAVSESDPAPAPGTSETPETPEIPEQTDTQAPETPAVPDGDDLQESGTPAAVLANGKPITDDNIREIIYALKKDYPEGMRWTNDNSYFSQAIHMTGYGCAGFALICSDAAFGSLPVSSTHSDFDSIKVGDMLRVNNDTHSVVVLEKRADSVIVTEGNYNSSIHWGREISRQSLINGNFTVSSRYPA